MSQIGVDRGSGLRLVFDDGRSGARVTARCTATGKELVKAATGVAVKSEAASRGVQLHPAGGASAPRIPPKSLVSSSAWSLQSAPTTMTTNQTLETLSVDQLAPVTGGGIGSMIGGLFGAKGQQWGALADNILGMFGGLGGLAGGGSSSGGSSSGGSSSGSGSSGGAGGFASILGNLGSLGKLFSGFGGGSGANPGGNPAPTGGTGAASAG
jgi:hypothetical protein